jgi:Tol biopolymer transport system component
MSRTRAVAALASLVVLSTCSPAAAAGPGTTLLLSRPSGLDALPVVGDNHSFAGTRMISGNGQFVVFISGADDLGVRDSRSHVWLRDTFSNTTTEVDRIAGAPADGDASGPSISRDGSTLCFVSRATNLVPGVTGAHVYVVTRSSGATVVADRGDTAVGAVGNNTPIDCVLDATGGHVAFTSNAGNLVAGGDTNGQPDVFVRDLAASTTKRVSVSSTGAESPNGGDSAAITAAGTKVAFASSSPLVLGETPGISDIYVRDTSANTTARVSVGTGGVEANGSSFEPSLSDDGLAVAFASRATNLAGGLDDNGKSDVFVRLIGSDTTFAASRASTSGGALGDGDSELPSISGDGLGVAFSSAAGNLGAGAPPGPSGRWIYLRQFGGSQPTTLVSRASDATGGAPANGSNSNVSLNTDRSAASWSSIAGNLDPAGSGEFLQTYKRSFSGTPATSLVSRPSGVGPRSSVVNSSLVAGPRAMSADGRRVVMTSESDALDPGGADRLVHVYVRDTLTNTTTLVDRAAGASGAVGNDGGQQASISADGRRVVFTSSATNLLPGGNLPGAFVRDLETNEVFLASRKDGANGDQLDIALNGGLVPAINADGTRVAFVSDVPIGSGDTNTSDDIGVRDLAAGTTKLVSVGPNGVGLGFSHDPAMSADGNRVAFQSNNNLIGDPVPPNTHVYVRDLAAGTTVLADRQSSDGSPGPGNVASPQISADGNRVLFVTASALTPDPVPATGSVFVRDLAAQTTTLVNRADGASGPPVPSGFSERAALSQDGRHAAFMGVGPDVPGSPPSNQPQLYVRDLAASTTTLASSADGTSAAIANSPVFSPALSGDGGCVAFSTVADNLTDPDYGTRDFVQTYLRVVSGECPKPAPGPGPGPGPPGPGTGVPPDVTPPNLGALALSARKFKAARRGASVAARRRTPTGTRVTFRLSEAASVRFTVQRAQRGRRVGRRCVKPSRKNRKRRNCTRFVTQRGSFKVAGKTGQNRFRFTGRSRRRKLRPGSYRLVAVATDAAGNKSKRRRASFRIVR